MRNPVVLSLLFILSLTPPALGGSIADRLKNAQTAEHADKDAGEDHLVGQKQKNVKKADVMLRLTRKPTDKEVTNLRHIIFGQSSAVTDIRYIDFVTIQIILNRDLTEEERESFRAGLTQYDLVRDVEFAKYPPRSKAPAK